MNEYYPFNKLVEQPKNESLRIVDGGGGMWPLVI